MGNSILKVLCLVFVLVSTTIAGNTQWMTADGYWKDSNNWSVNGQSGHAVPTLSDEVIFWSRDVWTDPLGIDASNINVYIDKGTHAVGWRVYGLGGNGYGWTGTLHILSGGSLTVSNILFTGYLDDSAILVDGGTVDVSGLGGELRVGQGNNGTFTMRGGTASLNTVYMPLSGGSGRIYMDNGTFTVKNWLTPPTDGIIDIRGGLMRFAYISPGATTAYYQSLITNAKIVSFGGLADVDAADTTDADGRWTYITAKPKSTTPYLKTTPQSLTVNEQGTTSASYTLVLNTNPGAAVTVTIMPVYDPNRVNLGAGIGQLITKIFSAANWNVPQTVTVTAVDDAFPQGTTTAAIRHTANTADSNDINYNGVLAYADVMARVMDNDLPTLVIVQSDGSTKVSESGLTDSFTIALGQNPGSSVTITADPNGNGPDNQLRLNGGAPNAAVTLTFTSDNWTVPQTVSVAAVDDTLANGNRTTIVKLTAAGGIYTGVNDAVNVAILDNECGAWGFNTMDFNQDCKVDIDDFSTFAQAWLFCTTPEAAGCVNLAP